MYIKEEFPADAHYASNENVLELIVVASEGFAFASDMKGRMKELDIKANRSVLGLKNVYGLSGYNNSLESMQTFLLAQGPDMASSMTSGQKDQKETEVEAIEVVDLFSLLCNLLEVDVSQAQSTSGNINRVKWLLRYPSDTEVVKVIRGWMSQALRPENVPITSKFRVSVSHLNLY